MLYSMQIGIQPFSKLAAHVKLLIINLFLYSFSLQFKLIIAQVLVLDFVAALLVDRVLQFLLGRGTLRLPK